MKLNTVAVYELSVYKYDFQQQEPGDNLDSEYVPYTTKVSAEQVMADNHTPTPNTVVYVYEARSATLSVGKSGTVEVYEADTATGYNGSPISELYYNSECELVDYTGEAI